MGGNSIFVVDDEPDVAELIKDLLVINRYRVWTFTNAKDMIAALREIRPDLILLDIMMPEMNGFELCKYIKTSDKLKGIKICFVSAKSAPDDIAKGREIGADDFIPKPFENRSLLAKVKALIGSAWEENGGAKVREAKPTESVMSIKTYKKGVTS
ncbi:response regulator [bacterium]|nr:response regulator [bacterium]